MKQRSIFAAAFLVILIPLALASMTDPADTPITGGGSEPPAGSREDADRLHDEGSYGLAREAYAALLAAEPEAEDAAWLRFRLADAAWRAEAASPGADTTEIDRARQDLEAMLAAVTREEDRDLVWAGALESLGDFWWARPRSRNWGMAWQYYRQALDWWARSSDIDDARERYLGIVWKAAQPPQVQPHYYYGYHGNQLPIEILDNVLEIVQDADDRARVNYLVAMTLRHQAADRRRHRRVIESFETALAMGRTTEWYDDALFHYAEWLASSGKMLRVEGGGLRTEPDYAGALRLYRQLVDEYRKGETRYRDDAVNRIENITRPGVGVAVSEYFLPGSEVRYHLSWRNVSRVDLALYKVDLTQDVGFVARSESREWLQRIKLAGRAPERTWTHETGDEGEHLPGRETLGLKQAPPPGAYVIEARAEGESVRDLVLITRGSLVVKTSGDRSLAYFCDALDGSPRPGADLVFWIRTHPHNDWTWDRITATTDEDGLAVVDLPRTNYGRQFFVSGLDGEDQAFVVGNDYFGRQSQAAWRIYAFTDRPAYRPGEQVQWKTVARTYEDGAYATPDRGGVRYELKSPRGEKVDEGDLELNALGSAWGAFDTDDTLALGQYRVDFFANGDHVGSAVLFRLEEYKLPEFKVEVTTPLEDGKPKSFRVGDAVEAQIAAEYYFGGPVSGATVEVLVYQKPLHVWWRPEREFPWFYEDIDRGLYHGWGGPGQIVKRETLKTDAEGRVSVSFETPANANQDFEYTVEARVTDASRREIVGRGSVRVSRQRYFAFARTAHQLYRPGDEVRVEIKTMDANDLPFEAQGRVQVTRDTWAEIWIDPSGREVGGDELKRARRRPGTFPPGPGWQLKFNGYEHETILDRLVTTGEDGETELDFSASREGYYRVRWSGDEDEAYPVHGETTVWVCDSRSASIGYRHGAVQIIVDRDTFQAGRRVPVMLSAPVEGASVLFTIEAEGIHDHRLVRMNGNVKLIEIDVQDHHVPNVFLGAVMVHDGEMLQDSRQVVVPPVRQFLDVEVTTDREQYLPGETGVLRVTTRNHEGDPVPAEVALALVDESVFYIEKDLAGDPRQFFFGTKRGRQVLTMNSLQQKPLGLLAKDDAGAWTDRRDERKKKNEAETRFSDEYIADLPVPGRAYQKVGARSRAQEAMVLAEADTEGVAASAPAPSAEGAGGEPAVQVRSDFRSTALWRPDVVTGENGNASVELTFPDSLTTWRATGRAVAQDNRFGMAGSQTRTSKPLIVRLQTPRFFVVGDSATISAIVNNNTDEEQRVGVSLRAEGVELLGLADDPSRIETSIDVPANGEARVDWKIEAREAGTAAFTVVARGNGHDDAMERSLLVHEHGVEKFLSRSGKVRGGEVRVELNLPAARRPGSTAVSVQVTPSLAVTMLDALPYLIDYPYGCTEQTMSRFLPAVITARTLEDLGLEPGDVAGRIFGGIESEHVHRTHTKGKQDMGRLDDMVHKGLDRLYDFQRPDGGWGWWKQGESDLWMTAYVVWGLGLAEEAGVDVRSGVLRRGAEYLDRQLVEAEERPELQAFMLHAVTSLPSSARPSPNTRFETKALDNLWERRGSLEAYGRALLALSAHQMGDDERARVLARNLTDGVRIDRTPDRSVIQQGIKGGGDEVMDTAYWGSSGFWWRWYESPVESTSFVLRALLAIDPDSELIEPATNWLIKNRRGAQWSNTRDTAMTVLVLGDYLQASGELGSDIEYEVRFNGKSVARERIAARDILGPPSRFFVDPHLVRDGANEVRIVRLGGDGAVYFAAEAEFFSLEEPITPSGNEIFARRNYYKRVARPTLLRGFTYENRPLADRGRVVSGERVEVVLTIEAKNDYEYLVFEDLKPAGLEAVQLKSGQPVHAREVKSGAWLRPDGTREGQDYTGRSRWVYQELRDRKVAMFVDKLPQGVWEIRYELRAETPGEFHALPVMGHAMYVPEIRANGAEVRMEVLDR